jgi:hypothetical protein
MQDVRRCRSVDHAWISTVAIGPDRYHVDTKSGLCHTGSSPASGRGGSVRLGELDGERSHEMRRRVSDSVSRGGLPQIRPASANVPKGAPAMPHILRINGAALVLRQDGPAGGWITPLWAS